MLFNSPEFLFVFLPFAVLLHFALARHSMQAAIVGLTVTSLVFYAWWNPPYVALPILSIVLNFALASLIAKVEGAQAKRLLIFGIAGNLLVLCYYKYADFLRSIIDGHTPAMPDVPLALSFTTFVQLAFLVYVYQRRPQISFFPYALFVAFFPHLIAGPIVRWGSFGRQITDPARYRPDWSNIALGLTMLVLGLAKKLLIADSLSPHVAPVFEAAARGDAITMLAAWGGAVAFSLQIFFDFSGYSDMAVGLGLLFNFRLPINFAAPLRATNIADCWRRWHITLSRLARDLIYVPLARGDVGVVRRYAALMLTMVVIGVWHGAGWTFVAWGAFNGALLIIHAIWVSVRGARPRTPARLAFSWLLTFGAFAVGAVFFRAASMDAALHLIATMFGAGADAATAVRELTNDDWLIRNGYASEPLLRALFGASWTLVASLWTLLALAVMLIVPDTMEITGYREGDAQSNWRRPVGPLVWQPSLAVLIVTAALFVAVFASLGRVSEFFYYQF